MLLGVIGNGVVGNAIVRSFIEHVTEVRIYDVNMMRRTHSLKEVAECRIIFVCVPTPATDKSISLINVTKVMKDLEEANLEKGRVQQTAIVIKSTVPVGTTRTLSNRFELPLVHSPEFLTARCAVVDAHVPSRNIVGALEDIQSAASALARLYQGRFAGIQCKTVSAETSELSKLVCNSFFSTKISFFNEIYDYIERYPGPGHLSWERLMSCVMSDGRIAQSHVDVPGPDGKFGFGGECLPKDLRAFANQVEEAGGFPNILKAAIRTNNIARQ